MVLQPNPALDRLRVLPRRVGGSRGTGERRARTTGAGMEFADYRPYQPGDDPRHIDPQLYQRFGTLNLRQFSASKQLMLILCIDASASMGFGGDGKLKAAKALCATLAQAALMGGDAVQVLSVGPDGLRKSDIFARRTDVVPVLNWISAITGTGGSAFHRAIGTAAQGFPREALVVIASDFWSEENPALLRDLAHEAREIWLAQILSSEERAPKIESDGTLAVTDAETGEEVILPAAAARDYLTALSAWNDALAKEAAGLGGQCISLAPETEMMTRLLSEAWIG